MSLSLLTALSTVRLYIPKDLRPKDARQTVFKSIQVSLCISRQSLTFNRHLSIIMLSKTGGKASFLRQPPSS